jgi:hypothetical protein
MADGQTPLAVGEQPSVTVTTEPNAPVATIPSAPSTAMLPQATAADVMAGIQAAQNPPQPNNLVAPNVMGQQTPTLPAQAALDVSRHHSFWDRILEGLDRAGSILGGDQTMHIRKDTDGNVSITRDPSTMGEKWGRVAAAALGGLSQGLANAQGPGGTARAAAAGIQYGMQLPQQQQQQVEQEATAEQKIMMNNASNAMLHQKAYGAMLDNQALGMAIAQEDGDNLNKILNPLLSSPNAKDYGPVGGWDELNRIRQDPDFIKHHMNGQLTVIPIRGANGRTELHAVATDRSYDNQRVGDGETYFDWKVDPQTGRPVSFTSPITAGSMTHGELQRGNQGRAVQFLDAQSKWGSYQKTQQPPKATGSEFDRFYDTWRRDNNLPDTAANELKARKQYAVAGSVRTGEGGGGVGIGAGMGGGGGIGPTTATTPAAVAGTGELGDEGTLLSQFTMSPSPQGEQILSRLPTGEANLIKRFGNYLADEGKELPRGKEREPFLEMVSNIYPNFSSAAYTARQKLLTSLQGDGKMAQSRNALNLAIQHMGEMYNNMQTINPTEYPVANQAAKTWHDQGLGKAEVKAAYGGYQEANEGVASEMARVYKGGAPTQGEIEQYRGHSDITAPKSMQLGGFETRARMLASRLENLNQQLRDGFSTPGRNYQLLTPKSIETLHNLPGGNEILRQAGISTAPPSGGAANTQTPPATGGGTIDVPAGNKTYHFRTQADADAFKARARQQGVNIP